MPPPVYILALSCTDINSSALQYFANSERYPHSERELRLVTDSLCGLLYLDGITNLITYFAKKDTFIIHMECINAIILHNSS